MLYRMKHMPSGLYYIPVRIVHLPGYHMVKSNLSKTGKVYHTKPKIDMGEAFNNHLNLKTTKHQFGTHTEAVREKFKIDEWVVEEIQ